MGESQNGELQEFLPVDPWIPTVMHGAYLREVLLRNSDGERDKPRTRLLTTGNKLVVTRGERGGGERVWDKEGLRIEECTCSDEHWVLFESVESCCCTPETIITLYVDYIVIKIEKRNSGEMYSCGV